MSMRKSRSTVKAGSAVTCVCAAPLCIAGARMLARMGWQPGQGLGKQPGSAVLVLPQLKWDKTGLGGSTQVKQLGAPATRFRSAGVTLPPGAAAEPAAGSVEA